MLQVGYYPNLSEKDYHADHAISSSTLVHALRSYAHFWSNYVGNPNRVPQEDTKAFKFGRAIHKFLLEPHDFANRYMIAPRADKRTKEGKLLWANTSHEAEKAGAELITHDDAANITAMSDAMRDFFLMDDNSRSINIMDIFRNGTAEESFVWKDAESGLMLRARTDWRIGDIIIDYKTTQDARPFAFAGEIAKRRYYMRAAMYVDGVEAVTGKRPKDFYIVAQEKAAPFCPAAYRINPDDMAFGRRQYKNALMGIKWCFENNKWTGYSELVQTLSIPAYYYAEANC